MKNKAPIQFGEPIKQPSPNQDIEIDFKDLPSLKSSLKKASTDIKTDIKEEVTGIAKPLSTQNIPPAALNQFGQPALNSTPHVFSDNLYSKSQKLGSLSILIGITSLIAAILVLALPYLSVVATHLPMTTLRHIMDKTLYITAGINAVCSLFTIMSPLRIRALLGFGLTVVTAVSYYSLANASFLKR